ncbi:hypothetical protein [Bacillus thermotolerans]|uniref:Uncharacterized protein n=1 Tax=Bacillus thermotolerans TaxID=1221996 RepID=A0A0F5HMP4_BACTR|nr:hypothetical protein [Bacillus thermotolerans]KKB34654.1 hypothetical protein QY97_02204 [Bacillus thermotolerans]KKB38572.1 hypothetical protein QY95_02570 [Bacillus thermotolerans]
MQSNELGFTADYLAEKVRKANEEAAVYYGKLMMANNRIKELEAKLSKYEEKQIEEKE